ncbi:hypothetical protein J4206_05045 [Candidatus Woesearchaeota archaeon]|nr:hypothetical protein [Candidatus Woesearchaeota archaeon]
MKTNIAKNKILCMILLAVFIAPLFSIYAAAGPDEDRRAAFSAWVAFGTNKNDRAILNLREGPVELFVVRTRYDFEKAVEKVKARLFSNPQFYEQIVFGNPWGEGDINGFDVHSYMEEKARELDATEPGTLEYYYSEFKEKKGTIRLDIKIQKYGREINANDMDLPLISVIRERDDYVLETSVNAITTYILDRDIYKVVFGTLPGYKKPAATDNCMIDAINSNENIFNCQYNYVKKPVGKQVTAKANSKNEIEVKFPIEMESEVDDLEQTTTYEIKDNTNADVKVTAPRRSTDPSDTEYYKILIQIPNIAEDKTHTLSIKKGSNIVSTVNIVTNGLVGQRQEIATLPSPEVEQIKSVEMRASPSLSQIVVEQGQQQNLGVLIEKIVLAGGTRTRAISPPGGGATTTTTTSTVAQKELTEQDEIKSKAEYFKWKWSIYIKDAAGNFVVTETKDNKDNIQFAKTEAGNYKVELKLDYSYTGLFVINKVYPLTQTPISWTINVVANNEQLGQIEEEIVKQIDEVERKLEVANDFYLRKDANNARTKIGEGQALVGTVKGRLTSELAGHVRNKVYTQRVDDLNSQLTALEGKVSGLSGVKNMAAINELVNNIKFNPVPGSVSGGVSQIVITPFTATDKLSAFSSETEANTEVGRLIKRITKYESTQFEPVTKVEDNIKFPYAITPQTKIIKLQLKYKDTISNEEIPIANVIEWKFGEIERAAINRDYKIKAPEQIIKDRQAEFVVVKEDNSEETGAANFLWTYSMGGGISVREPSTINKFSKKFDAHGEYVIEASFELGGKRITGVKQRFIVSDLTTFTDAQLIAEYNKANRVLDDARQYVAKVEKDPATADITIIDEHLRKLVEAGEVYKQVEAKKGTIFSVIGLSDSRFNDAKIEITTTLPAKLNDVKTKKTDLDTKKKLDEEIAAGTKIGELDVKIIGEIAPNKVEKDKEVEFVVVDKRTQQEFTSDKIKTYTWTIKKGSPEVFKEKITVNKIKRTFAEAAVDYKISVKFDSDVIVADIADKTFEVLVLSGAIDADVLRVALGTADKKLEDALADYAKPDHNLEQDKKLAKEASGIYTEIKTEAIKGSSPIITDAEITAKIAAATKLIADINRVLAKQNAAHRK